MTRLKKILLTALLLVLLLVLAAWIWKDQLKAAILPELQEFHVSTIIIVDDSASVYMNLGIRNKNVFNYNLSSVSVEVFNDSLQLLNYKTDSSIVLMRNEEKNIPVHFMLPIKKISKRIRNLQSIDSTELSINGSIILKTPAGDLQIPVHELFSIRVPTPPEIKVNKVEYLGSSHADYDFLVHADVTNKSDQKIEIRDFHYAFHGDDMLETEGTYDKKILVEPKATLVVELPVKIHTENRLKLLSKVIFNNDVIGYNLKLTGTVVSIAGINQEMPIIFRKRGEFELVNKDRKNKIEITRRDD